MNLFIELLQLALGNRLKLSQIPKDSEWLAVYEEAEKQSIVGMLLCGLESLQPQQRPPQDLLLQWIGTTQLIEEQNKKLDCAAELLTRIFKEGRHRTCVLKGQGLAQLYPIPSRRQPGDIDLWVEGDRNDTLQFLKDSFFKMGNVVIHHVDCYIVDDIVSEIHFMPVWAYNPIVNHHLQKYFRKHADSQFANYDKSLGYSHPTNGFNTVYCLAHIYMHFLYEGIGMRQLIDYYYVVKSLNDDERVLAAVEIKKIGLKKIAGAVMYILHNVCGMREEQLLLPVDNKRGELLFTEILRGGNFGHSDERVAHSEKDGRLKDNIKRIKREFTLIRHYPFDVLCIPIWKVCHYVWRKWNGYL